MAVLEDEAEAEADDDRDDEGEILLHEIDFRLLPQMRLGVRYCHRADSTITCHHRQDRKRANAVALQQLTICRRQVGRLDVCDLELGRFICHRNQCIFKFNFRQYLDITARVLGGKPQHATLQQTKDDQIEWLKVANLIHGDARQFERIQVATARRAQLGKPVEFIDPPLHLGKEIDILQRRADLPPDVQHQVHIGLLEPRPVFAANYDCADRFSALENRYADAGAVPFRFGSSKTIARKVHQIVRGNRVAFDGNVPHAGIIQANPRTFGLQFGGQPAMGNQAHGLPTRFYQKQPDGLQPGNRGDLFTDLIERAADP